MTTNTSTVCLAILCSAGWEKNTGLKTAIVFFFFLINPILCIYYFFLENKRYHHIRQPFFYFMFFLSFVFFFPERAYDCKNQTTGLRFAVPVELIKYKCYFAVRRISVTSSVYDSHVCQVDGDTWVAAAPGGLTSFNSFSRPGLNRFWIRTWKVFSVLSEMQFQSLWGAASTASYLLEPLDRRWWWAQLLSWSEEPIFLMIWKEGNNTGATKHRKLPVRFPAC